MSFELGGQMIVLKSDPGLDNALVSLKSMKKALSKEKERILVELCNIETTKTDPLLSTCPQVQQMLSEFSEVFHTLEGLPPKRDHDHAIVFKEGTDPIRVRPYRYP